MMATDSEAELRLNGQCFLKASLYPTITSRKASNLMEAVTCLTFGYQVGKAKRVVDANAQIEQTLNFHKKGQTI